MYAPSNDNASLVFLLKLTFPIGGGEQVSEILRVVAEDTAVGFVGRLLLLLLLLLTSGE